MGSYLHHIPLLWGILEQGKLYGDRLVRISFLTGFLSTAVMLAITFFLNWPVPVVYACTCLDEVGKIPWVMYHYRKYIWVKDLTRAL